MRTIHDVFGADVRVAGRFEPEVREDGLLAIGASRVAISSSGFEQFAVRARDIASQVLAPGRRDKTMVCEPSASNGFDAKCARDFVTHYGRLLYRRPLSEGEIGSVMELAEAAVAGTGDFYRGLRVALARMLVSPNFLFRIEEVERDPSAPGGLRFTDYTLAARISFLLWDSAPDAELLDAAAAGELRSEEGLSRQVERLIASPRFNDGVRVVLLGHARL